MWPRTPVVEHHVREGKAGWRRGDPLFRQRRETALVIGVQGSDLDTVTRYAQHAEKLGADAIVSLPRRV